MPSPLDQLPADATSLARRVQTLERQLRELMASRRGSNATIGGGNTTITGARIQTAADGARVVLDAGDGSLKVYDTDDNLTNYVGGIKNLVFNQTGFPDGEFVGMLSGNLILGIGNGLGEHDTDLGTVGLLGVIGSGDAMGAQSPSNATNPDPVFVIYRSGNTGATPGSAAAPHVENEGDLWVNGAALYAAFPPAGGPLAPATWQTPTWGAGWSGTNTLGTMGGFRSLQAHRLTEDRVWVLGAATATGTSGTIGTLSSDLWPPTNSRVLLDATFFKGGVVTPAKIQVTEAGALNSSLSLGGVTPASGTQVFINSHYTLGNTP